MRWLPATLGTFYSVSEKLLDLSEFGFHEFEVLLCLLDVLSLKRRLRFGRIRLHALLSRDNVSAKLQTLGTLCTLQTVETGVDRCFTRGNLIHLMVQFGNLSWIGPRRLRARLTLCLLATRRLRARLTLYLLTTRQLGARLTLCLLTTRRLRR